MDKGFWDGRRVFITGHTGFKGTWLTLWLQKLGAKLFGYALAPPTVPNMYTLVNCPVESSVQGDVRDLDALTSALSDCKPEIVIHLAAQPLVRESYNDPVGTYATNVMGVVNLFEAIRKVGGVKAVLNVTSDKCYENREWVWGYRENEPMGGWDPYSSSKGCSELVTSAYRRSYFDAASYDDHGCAIATARAGNVVGGGDWAIDRLVPDALSSLSENRQFQIRSPSAIRPWQHVLEPLCGYMILVEKLYIDGQKYSGAWNFGPNLFEARSVEWVASKICELWGVDGEWVLDNGPQLHEANYLKLDSSKSNQELGWCPKWSTEQALSRVVSWHKAWLSKDDMYKYSLSEIDFYCDLGG